MQTQGRPHQQPPRPVKKPRIDCDTAKALVLAASGGFLVAAFLPWVNDRRASKIPLKELITVTGEETNILASLAVPLIFAAAITFLAVILDWRTLAIIGASTSIGTAALWLLQQVIEKGEKIGPSDLQVGAWAVICGVIVAFIGSLGLKT